MGEEPHDPAAYGEAWAEVYDEVHGDLDTAAAVEAVAALAGGGPVCEFGVGTGRLALPLAARGITVHGIDAAAAMLDRLRAKPGAERLTLTHGDFTTVRLDRTFALVLLAFNTLFSLPTQEDQVRCFAAAAAHLRPGGAMVVEAFVPGARRPAGEAGSAAAEAGPAEAAPAPVEVTLERHDPVTQRVRAVHMHVVGGAPRFLPLSIRYAWPSEIDLMARLAGLSPEQRWGDWRGSPFTAASTSHVSVYRLPA